MSSSLSLYTPDMDNNLVLDPELHLDDLYQSGPDSGYNSLESAGMSTSGSHADFGPGAGDQQYLDRQWSGVDSVPHTEIPPRTLLDDFKISDPTLLPCQLEGQFMLGSTTMGDMGNLHTYYEGQPPRNHTVYNSRTHNLIGNTLEQRFSPKAVAFVKTWIEHSPGVPSPADIAWLAEGTGQQVQDIEEIFGHILRGNSFATTKPPKNSSIDSLANRAQNLQLRINTTSSETESEDIFKKAAEWVAQNPTSCRSQRDSRSSQDSTRIYKCTVGCEQCFPRPDVWKEHEEKVHPPKAWLCNIAYTVQEGKTQKCGYCGLQDPDMNHWEALHPRQIPCSHKPFARGTTIFHPRKLFLSHLKNVHPGVTHSQYLSENFFDVQPSFDKECPICHIHQFEDWNERSYHLRSHFEPPKIATAPLESKLMLGLARAKDGADARLFGGKEMPVVARYPVVSISRHENHGVHDQSNFPDIRSEDEQTSSTKVLEKTLSKSAVTSLVAALQPPIKQSVVEKEKTSTTMGFMNAIKYYFGKRNHVPAVKTSIEVAPNISTPPSTAHSTKSAILTGVKVIPTPRLVHRLMDARIRTYDMRYFIPRDSISRILTKKAVHGELFPDSVPLRSSEDLRVVDVIIKDSQRLFGILTMLGLSLAIREFLAEGISDPDLPFKIANPIPIADHGQKEHLTLQTNSGQTIEAFSRWPHRDISNFLRDQWCFLAPQFKQGMLHMIIDDSVVLPYVEYTSDGSKEGGFSSVWGVRIHASHQDHYEATQDGTAPRIALKRLHSANYDRFERETHMLKQLAPRNHPHLIKLLGTYYHQHSYHLMFPYAPENLRGYWQRIGNPWEKTKIIEWSFRQLRGIASGLETIHDFSIGGTYETESDTLSVPSSNPRSQWGRHGDIKPENILWFENDQKAHGSNHDLGLLVLGDFGLMEFHGARTRSNVDPESIGGTPTYEPPEKRLRLPISRAFDMWSMGCMMLEFITWLLESSEGVDRFSDFRAYMVYDELSIDPFYEIQFQKDGQMYSSAVVNPRVLEWIDRLSKHDRSTQMIRDLLILVRDRLLVVDSRERMTSQELVRELDKMLEWANDDTEYMSRIQGASISRKSALRYDSSTEDLRQGGGGKRVKILLEPTDSDNLDELLIIP